MNIPQEFEDIFRGVELAEDEIRTLTWVTGWEHRTVENLRSAIRKAQATALSTLQGENEKLRETVDKYATAARVIALHLKPFCDESLPYDEMIADAARKASDELEQVTAERDAAVEAVKNMAEYIVCAGRVDYYLCDEISQEHHLKYQPKNDGNYDNEPCYKCIADWFLQGHEWQENC